MSEMKAASAGPLEPTTSPAGRSTSPHAGHCRPSGALTHRGPLLNSWMGDGTMASPRTPRQHQSELRVGLAMSELQRQVAEDRRTAQRQWDAMERRLQEHLSAPAANRERWADLQGSVSGLLEEVANLVRRVEGLDEKLRIRTASCEELLRQRSRELEQQLHGQQQKVQLAVSTFEEMSKRQTSKLRKVVSSSEEHSRKLAALEDMTRRAQMGPTSPLEAIQARLSELEGQQASLEEEFRHVTASTAVTQAISPRHAPPTEEYDVGARLLESELAKLSKQLATQLDEHSAALANLRVRTESQEQRLSAAGDRLEKLVAPTLEALRSEMHQLRAAERAETEGQLEHLTRQLKDLSETNEDAIAELKDLQAAPGNHPVSLQEMQQMRETCAIQEDQLQRLMAYLDQGLPREEMDLPDVVFRVERLENRMDSFNQDAMSEKADRCEIHRLDLALEELQQPLRRLSQRTASNEARTTGLEHRLEQFQEKLPNAVANSTLQTASNEQADAAGVRIAEISARVMELEELLPQISSRAAAHQGHERKEFLQRLEKLEAGAAGAGPASEMVLSNEVRAQMDEVSDMASKALKIAENSGNNMQALRFDLVVEQDRVAKLGKELQSLSNSFRDEQGKIQRTAERQEDQEQRAGEAMQKIVASIDKVQGLQHGYEGGTSALNKLVESIAKRVEAAEVALGQREKDGGFPAASEVHMLRDEIKADLLELQEERFKNFQQSMAKGGSAGSGPKEDATLVPRVEEMARRLEDLEKQLSEKVQEVDKKLKGLRRDLDDALQRVEASEEASKAVREELMAEDQNEAYTLARTCQNDLRGVHSDVADLQASLRKLASRIEGLPPGARAEAPKTLENRVQELQKQMTEELEQLTKHQQLISKVGLKGKVDTQELERSVNSLASQVSQELTELRTHQRDLSKVQQMVRTNASKDGSNVESKLEELKVQVVAEVDALAQQQAELGKAKVTMSELSERVQQAVHTANECKQATNTLEERLKSLSSEARPTPAVESTAKPQARPTPAVESTAKPQAMQSEMGQVEQWCCRIVSILPA
eukprot:s216_g44.t2